MGTDDGLENLVVQDVAPVVDFHFTRHCQPVNVGVQGTNPVGQPEWQHWNYAVGQVRGRATFVGLVIQRRAGHNVIRNVGDVHPEAPVTVWQLGQADRVVEVLGVVAVNGDDHFIGDVTASHPVSSVTWSGMLLACSSTSVGNSDLILFW